jgi:hypothetical protein
MYDFFVVYRTVQLPCMLTGVVLHYVDDLLAVFILVHDGYQGWIRVCQGVGVIGLYQRTNHRSGSNQTFLYSLQTGPCWTAYSTEYIKVPLLHFQQ